MRLWRLSTLFFTLACSAFLLGATSASALDPMMPCFIEAGTSTCPGPVTTRQVDLYASDLPNYKGWATIRSNMGFGTVCSSTQPDCVSTTSAYPVTAWKWTANGWAKRSLADGTRVYAWPYGAGWEWAWTSATGWLAVKANAVYIRTETRSCIVNGINVCPQMM